MDYKDLGGLNEDNFKPDELFEDIGDDEYIKGKRKDEEKESKKAGRYDN